MVFALRLANRENSNPASEKAELLKILITVLVAAPLGFLFWLLWRRATSSSVKDGSVHRSTAGGMVTNQVNIAILDADRLPEYPSGDEPLEESDEEFAKDTGERAEIEQPQVLETHAPTQPQTAESTFSGEVLGEEPIARDAIDTSEVLLCPASTALSLPSSIEISPEHSQPAEEPGIADNNGDHSAGEPIPRAAGATATFGDGLQTEPASPETPVPEVSESLIDRLTEEAAGIEREQPEQPEPVERETEKTPQRYRPPPQKPPRQTTARPANQELQRAAPSEVSCDIRIRLTFDRFGFCAIALLPERTSDLDNEVAVKLGGKPVLLMAQEDWYQDLQVENIGGYLRQGVELRGVLKDDRSARWLLTGRDLYVLASHHRASGFVSTNRLALGRCHVVLCVVGLLHEVEAILNEAGCEGYTRLDESHGVPSGWVGLRNVTPTKAISLNLGSDPFYAVKPPPDIEIDLEGGVCLRNSIWLAGYPPQIRLLGESSAAVRVLVDDKEAQPTAEGFFIVDGYDTSGRHSVYCEGLSCSSSYSIHEPPDSWQEWPAHHFAQADICGPLVQPAAETVSGRLFTGPMSNPLLIGAEPGQIFRCSPRNVAFWKGFVPFEVVWALPAQPLQCNKKTARILQFASVPVAPLKPGRKPGLVWSNAILDASRKGLLIENGSSDSTARWNDYKKAARNIWRAAR
jgi:hypothetical protein